MSTNVHCLRKAASIFCDLVAFFDDFAGCSCCVSDEDCNRLGGTPLKQLTYDDLERYSRKAISKWGEAHHLKHFLLRLLEISIEHRDDFLEEAAIAMRVTAKTVLGEITRGNIKAVKVGKGFRINIEQLRKLGM